MRNNGNRDLILTNAKVITLDQHASKRDWVFIKEGIIRSLGVDDDWQSFRVKDSIVIDCRGKTVMPGFIDPHFHLFFYAESLVTLDLRPINDIHTISDIQSRISTFSKGLIPGTWIRGNGYDEFYLAEKRHPDRWDLDEAVRGYPVKLSHRSGHAHVLNSLGLSQAGISPTTPDPPGGMIDRDLKTGEPTGLLYEMGSYLSDRIPSLSVHDLENGVDEADRNLISMGITTIHDASSGNSHDRWELLKSWKEKRLLKPRVRMMLGMKSLKAYTENDYSGYIDQSRLRIAGIKIILDETTGRLHPSNRELNEMVLRVHEQGLQVSIHAIEENAVEAACEAIGLALKEIPKEEHRHRIEHCSVCSPSLAKKLASLGIVVVSQPSFIWFNGDRYLKTVPARQLEYLYPFGSLLKTSVMLAGSSDCPIVSPNPFVGISAAAAREAQTGDLVLPEEKITVLDALRLYTINGAYALFEDKRLGTVSPGKLADLIVLNDDPTRLPPDKIRDLEVVKTIIDGEIVWDKEFRQ